MTQRIEQIKIATRLQEVLGSKYIVRFDDCESCLTRVYYKAKNGEMIKTAEVPNTEMHSGLAINDFMLTRDKILELMATGSL